MTLKVTVNSTIPELESDAELSLATSMAASPQEIQEIYNERDKKLIKAEKATVEGPTITEDTYESTYDSEYDEYVDQRSKAFQAGDNETVDQWDSYWGDKKQRRNTFNAYWECTANNCDDDRLHMGVNDSEEFRYDALTSFEPLLKSLRRTQEDYKSTDEEIIRQYASDMTFNDINLFSLAKTAIGSTFFSDEQEQEDIALQLSVWHKVKGTEEGSRPTPQQVGDVAAAAITDPFNLIALAGGPSGESGKLAVQKMAGKEIAKYLVKNLIKGKVGKTARNWAFFMGGYSGLHNLGQQQIAVKGDIAKEVDWSSAATSAGIGSVMGGSMGALIGGGSIVFNKVMERYMRRKNITNKEALAELRGSVNDEASLYRWLKDIGWSKKEALEELNFLDKHKFKFDKEQGVWLSKESGAKYRPRMEERLTEGAHFGNKSEMPLVVRNIIDRGQRLIDKEYVNVNSLNVPLPFTKIRQGAFDILDKTFGATFSRVVRSSDAVLTRIGERVVAKNIKEAHVATDINTARLGNKLRALEDKFGDELGDLNLLIRNRQVTNSAQKEYLKIWDTTKNDIIYKAFRLKYISKKEYNKWKKDMSYIPRVWNIQHLLTDKGAADLGETLGTMWKKDPETLKNILSNLTDKNKELMDAAIKSKFSNESIQNIFRRKVDREMDVHRSSHLEHERKIHIPEKWEHKLDPFMAKTSDRLVTFAYDGYKRNEFASRFGAKDQRIVARLKELEGKGKTREAEHLREAYFTTMGDASRSKTIQAKLALPDFMRAVNKINAAQTVTKLGTAAIPNATQAFVNGATLMAKTGNIITAPFKAVRGLVRAIVKDKADMEIVHNLGVLGEMDLAKIATENSPHARIFEREFKGPFKYINEPTLYLRAIGFIPIEEMNRRAAALMAVPHVKHIHKQLLKRVDRGKADTKKTRAIERELNDLGINDPYKSELTAQDYIISGHMFNKHVNFSGESYNLPLHWQTPYFKLMTKFKSFMFYQARFLQRNVIDEAILHGNPKPLAMYLGAAGVAGNAADVARSIVKGKDIEENKNAIEYLVRGIGNAGGAGLFWDTLQQVSEGGMRGVGSLTGPTVSDVVGSYQELTKGEIDKILLRLVPNVPGKNQLTQQWRDQ